MNPIVGEPPAIQWVAIDRLMVDPTYQRPCDASQSENLIRAIARDWDWRLCQPLMVSSRDGNLFVIDGQHRMEGAKRRGDIPHLPCSVATYESATQEAAIFVRANRGRKSLTVLDIFRASVAAGEGPQSDAYRMITDAGLTIANHTNTRSLQAGAIANVNGVMAALRKHSKAHVSAALTAIGEAFGKQPIPRAATIFGAILTIYVRADESFDPDLLIDTLGTMTAAEWIEYPELENSSATVRVDVLAGIIRREMAEHAKDGLN